MTPVLACQITAHSNTQKVPGNTTVNNRLAFTGDFGHEWTVRAIRSLKKTHQTSVSLTALPLINDTLCSQSSKLYSRSRYLLQLKHRSHRKCFPCFHQHVCLPGSRRWLWCSKSNSHGLWLTQMGDRCGPRLISRPDWCCLRWHTHNKNSLLCQTCIWGLPFHQSFWRRTRFVLQPEKLQSPVSDSIFIFLGGGECADEYNSTPTELSKSPFEEDTNYTFCTKHEHHLFFFSVKQKFLGKEDIQNQVGSWGAKS